MKKYLAVLKRFLRLQKPNNLKVVVYCILTAATFWFFSALNKQYDATVDYPVAWDFDQEKYIAIDELPDKLQMNVSGLGWNLLRANSWIKVSPITLHLSDPVSKKRLPGSYFANQVAEELEQLQLNYIIEDSLRFNIDYLTKQSFPVYIDSANINLEEGFRITSPITYDPNIVEVEGPKEFLQAMPKDTFMVHVIETNIDEDFNNEIPFQLEYPDLMRSRPQTVKVSFNVNKFNLVSVRVPVNIIFDTRNDKLSLIDTIATVNYLVQENLEDSVKAADFLIDADLNKVNPADSTIQLILIEAPPQAVEPYIDFPQLKVTYNE